MAQDLRPTRGPAPLKPLLAVLLACVAVAALFGAGVAADRYGNREPAAAATPAGPATPTPTRGPGVGDPVRDGKFEFVVSRVDCSRSTVGVEHLRRTAKGKYCVVSLTVRNIAGGARYLVGRAQKMSDAAGTGYAPDEIAGVYANHNTDTFVEKLEPGERVSGKLVFDVPRTVEPAGLELHDSPLSGGAEITLR